MTTISRTLTITLALASVAATPPSTPQPEATASPQVTREPRVDVLVKLENARAVFNLDHLAFQGDLPIGLNYMRLFAERLKETGAKGHVIGIFHGPAAYLTLNDRAYNANRNVTTGNPYKQLIANLLERGVQLEECAVSMKRNGWTNEDLLPGVRVNGGAIGRLVELVQQGYVQIQP